MIKPVVLNCTPVLPTAYSDALSYYEEVCKLTHKINELVELINSGLEPLIKEQLHKLFVDTMYDEETETLVLTVNMKEA